MHLLLNEREIQGKVKWRWIKLNILRAGTMRSMTDSYLNEFGDLDREILLEDPE